MIAVADLTARDVATAEQFRVRVVEPCRPVAIRGLVEEWRVTRAANESSAAVTQYLRAMDTGGTAEAFVGDPSINGRYYYGEALAGFNFTREPLTITQALERIVATAGVAGQPSVYVGSLPTDAYLAGFADDNRLDILPAAVRPRIWFGHASSVACHHDNADNLACVVAGKRRFTLYPPEAIGDLYVGPIDHTMAGQPVSLAVGSPPGDPRFPRYAEAQGKSATVDLMPGDALYVPKLWWHQVEATAPFNILVNYWWDATGAAADSPYTTMLMAVAAIADRPAGERAAWRAFFDHYAFRPDGHPLAHVPGERHGILGTGQRGRLRAMAMRMLRGG